MARSEPAAPSLQEGEAPLDRYRVSHLDAKIARDTQTSPDDRLGTAGDSRIVPADLRPRA